MPRQQETIGARLRQARIAAGLSQEDIGDGLNLTRSAVSQWEKNQTEPVGENLRAVAEMLRIDISWLQTGRGQMPKRHNGGKKPKEEEYRRRLMQRMQKLIATGKFDAMLDDLGYVRKRR